MSARFEAVALKKLQEIIQEKGLVLRQYSPNSMLTMMEVWTPKNSSWQYHQ